MSSNPDVRDPQETPVKDVSLRSLMAHFPTGVAIVAACDPADDTDQGMTANSLTCVSLDPPLVAICLAHTSRTGQAIGRSQGFAVTLLAHDQDTLARQFSARGTGVFQAFPFARTAAGRPYIDSGIGYLECDVWATVPAGDHSVVIGQVTHSSLVGGLPLVFFRSKLGSMPHDHPPWAEATEARVWA